MLTDAQKKAALKYRRSEKGKSANIRYAQSEKGRTASARADLKYHQSEDGKIALACQRQTEKGRITDARGKAKRKRELGYNPINNQFEGSHGHHINRNDVLFIPSKLHQSISHSQNNLESMKEINDAAYEWLCTQEVI